MWPAGRCGDLHETLAIDIPPLTTDPLPAPDGMRPWEPWPAKTAAALFLAKLQELTAPGERCGSEDLVDIAGAIARERTISELAAAFTRLPARSTQTMRVGSGRQQPQGHLRVRGSR